MVKNMLWVSTKKNLSQRGKFGSELNGSRYLFVVAVLNKVLE